MDPLILILIGLSVIILSILVLKLHPVLALLFAAIIVGVLTTEDHLLQFAQSKGMSETETETFIELPVGKRIATAFGNAKNAG